MKKAIFVAATGQNVGKTTVCLGLMSGFKKQVSSVGYLKPVGQEHVEIEAGFHVDKDVVLFKEHFHLNVSEKEMSPILLPKGFTRDFLDGKIEHKALVEKISQAFQTISTKNEISIIEGTGHTGVGSIVNLNNAQVAKELNAPILLVASGGLGSSFDELALNFVQCEKYGAKVAGVILNRVLHEKKEMIFKYMEKALKRWNVPLLGAIPYDPFLSSPTMLDFEKLFDVHLLTGASHALRHFEQIRLFTSPSDTEPLFTSTPQLIITPANREEIVLSLLTRFWDLKISEPEKTVEFGIILTGRIPPKKELIAQIEQADIPTLYIPLSSFITMKMINTHTAKIRKDDLPKIEEAIRLVESHVDFDSLSRVLLTF
ncbi:MAG: cobyrinic acid a,c-diamide synthase [Chlamydiae bacterium]|nr:cobyrinic acid a,c-diamide synthase [Chlamydiota bacterium]